MRLIANRCGFTYILALTVVMIMGIMLGLVGQSWKTIRQREREKELLFRGSQIKEAIENWYNPNYTVPGIKRHQPIPLSDLKYLLKDPTSLSTLRYLPQSYAVELDDKNPRCAPDCAKQKLFEDPMTGREWTLIRGTIQGDGTVVVNPDSQTGGIVGVASKSEETPLKTDFRDTALENMGSLNVGSGSSAAGMAQQRGVFDAVPGAAPLKSPVNGGKLTKYSEWTFIADKKNDHAKIYRAYHEGW